ncbi:hypothetical protein CVT25_011486 [Psilocybe cyanescens]|uniref:Uncharacterized protein n=1 Tax=Psilocybe cyanescens TaxID=93625 RepID=A0A409XA27_PSICY|nr:hypothetical protein CVT25_011486 [Psilocybe cyanescens]
MRLHHCVLLSGIIALVQWTHLSLAQDTPSSSSLTPSCTFYCPPENIVSWKLAKRPFTVGFDSFYSIFECHTGSQALEAAGDNCPPQAIPCPESPSSDSDSQSTQIQTTPTFSHIDGEEVVPWVEGGRYLLYLSDTHLLDKSS